MTRAGSGEATDAVEGERPGPPAAEKKVSWAELFFVLVFVVAVTRVSALLEHDHDVAGLLEALVVFVPVYWLWVGTAVLTNLNDTARPLLRLRIFLVALAGLFMAIALPGAYDDLGLLFALAYWLGRLALGLPILVQSARARQWPINPYSVSIVVTGPLLVAGSLLEPEARTVVWAVAAIVDLSTPSLLASRLRAMRYDAGHLSERFGLFLLIALGESVVVVATSAGEDELTLGRGVAVAVAFAFACGLWWVYFHFAADAVRHSLATARVQLDVFRLVLSYGHLVFIGAVILVAVGLHDAVEAPQEHLGTAIAGLLFGGTALYLGGFGFTRWAMFRLVSWTRLGAAAVVLVLWPLASHVDALLALGTLTVVLVVLNAIELARVERIGWRARRGATIR